MTDHNTSAESVEDVLREVRLANERNDERKARELLAAEYDRDGIPFAADRIRTDAMLSRVEERAIRAIVAAITRERAGSSEQPEARIDFPGIGHAGPFPVVNGEITLPDVTMADLAYHFRMGWGEEQPAAAFKVGDCVEWNRFGDLVAKYPATIVTVTHETTYSLRFNGEDIACGITASAINHIRGGASHD